MNLNEQLLEFIEKSPTSYQAVQNIAEELEENGFARLLEEEHWEIVPGGRYYVVRNDSAILAFAVPDAFEGMHICASHADSPYFKIKESPQIRREGCIVLNIEKYGGMLLAPWFDRPLSIAGRLCILRDGKVETRLVDFAKDMLVIPSLAIHMNRSANDGVKFNVQDDMLPLYALAPEGEKEPDLIAEAARLADCSPDEVAGYDLFVYNHQRGSIWGEKSEFISAPRLDDLQCAYTTLQGFLQGNRSRSLCVYAVFDNEEVGSSTRQGASSTFLSDTLRRIYIALGRNFERYCRDLAKSFMISADNAHAVHPCFSSRADPVNRPKIGQGVVLKFSGNQKYCTDAKSAAYFRGICQKTGCRLQAFTNRADIPGGSTLGNLSNNQVALPTADIGLPQLAMHSPFETAGTADGEDMVKILREFFS